MVNHILQAVIGVFEQVFPDRIRASLFKAMLQSPKIPACCIYQVRLKLVMMAKAKLESQYTQC